MFGPCHALDQRAEGLRWCVCSAPAPPFRHGFYARREQRAALDAQVCCEAPFLAQPALCMHTSRAHYPAVRLGRTDHGRLPFFACTPCCLFRSPPVVLGTVGTGVLCPSYFRIHRMVCLSQHPVNETWVLRITVAWSLCALTMFHQDLFLCVLRRAMFFAPGHIERTPRPAWVAPSYGLRLTSICVLRSVFAIVVCGRAHRCMPVKSHAHHSAVGDSEPGPDSETLVSLRAQ
jgi:hypothetical protein